jgi:hypothetical protein
MTLSFPVRLLLMTPLLSTQLPTVVAAHPAVQFRSTFGLTVRAPLAVAVELFGAHGERAWAGEDWDPQFVHPVPPQDREGAVFLMADGGRKILDLTTIFDRAGGHVRHVFVRGDCSVTVIDIRLVALDAATTRVSVTYERTALNAEAEDEVRRLAGGDAAQTLEWETAIEAALRATRR